MAMDRKWRAAPLQGRRSFIILATGHIESGHGKQIVMLDYTGPNIIPAHIAVPTNGAGKFDVRLLAAPGAPVSALSRSGDDTHAPVATGPIPPAQQ